MADEPTEKYSAITMKVRLGLDATQKIKSPSGLIKPVSPITPEQFASKASSMPMLNNANHVAGQAMRQREVNTGLKGQEQPVPTVAEEAKNKVARQGVGQTKETIFGKGQ